VICPQCGSELPSGARFCPRDGFTVSSVGEATAHAKGDDPFVGRIVDGRYRVGKKLGAGGVGAVYEGEHVEIKKPVAIKVLHGVFASTEEFRLRFEREARAASRLDHPSCVTVLDFGRVQRLEPMQGAVELIGIPYLVMEFVRGQSLLDRLQDGPRLSTMEAVQIEIGVLGALKHAHSLGIIHRDVKPANVMLIPDEGKLRPKLLDFGLAKEIDAAEKETLTQAGMVFGTPSYLSPEQAAGGKADARSDLYAAGVMLFEMVCGRRPFVNKDPLDTVRDHLSTPPPKPRSLAPGISEPLEQVMLRALAKEPAARFQSADAFIAALAACPDGSRLQSRRPIDKKKLLLGGGVGAGLAVIFGLVHWLRGAPAPPPPPKPPPLVAPPAPVARDALSHLSLATDYQRKLWCSDAIEELERALRADQNLRHDPLVARIAISCLTPKTRAKAVRFLVEDVGAEARPYLQQAAASDENPEVRKGAEHALSRLSE
jgi:serine/threonine protein kinase